MNVPSVLQLYSSRRKLLLVEIKKSGSSRTPIDYEEELSKIAALDDSIEPEVMRGINYVRYKDDYKDNSKDDSCNTEPLTKKPRWDKPNKKSILNSLSETMMSIEKRKIEREASKEERRHDTMKAFMDLLSSFKKHDN